MERLVMETLNLVTPGRQHEYVIGIDFGHGETSAAYCTLDWDRNDAQSFSWVDLDLGSNSKVIVSAICQTSDGRHFIGEKALSSTVVQNQSALRVCFKAAPQDINGEAEQLMIAYMRDVYQTICENKADLLHEGNHIVYIARPSGWHDEQTKRLYEQMALQAGIPLAGLTSESRAAFFYAKNNPNIGFQKIVDQGAVVLDLGSSTLDFTYLSEGESAIDHGYPDGASIIDRVVYDQQIVAVDEVRRFTEKYPKLKDALLYEARKIKEKAYKEPELAIRKTICLEDVYPEDSEFADTVCRIRFNPIVGSDASGQGCNINQLAEQNTQYLSRLFADMVDFRDQYIAGRPVHGVFMTGGASRMDFVVDQIMCAFGLSREQVKRDDEPSLTISRGIALLGKADAKSRSLFDIISGHKLKLRAAVTRTDFTKVLSDRIAKSVWESVFTVLDDFRTSSRDDSCNQLIERVKQQVDAWVHSQLNPLIDTCVAEVIAAHVADVQRNVEKLVENYAPGKNWTAPQFEYSVAFDNALLEKETNERFVRSITSAMEKVAETMSQSISDILWTLVGGILVGIIALVYRLFTGKWLQFADDEEERRRKSLDKEQRSKVVDGILQKQRDIRQEIRTQVIALLGGEDLNRYFSELSENYITAYVDKVIRSVKIDIE